MAKPMIVIENKTRDVISLPTALEAPDDYVVIGDKADTDDLVPEKEVRGEIVRERDPIRQPNPVVSFTPAKFESFGPLFKSLLEDQVRQGRLRVTEISA